MPWLILFSCVTKETAMVIVNEKVMHKPPKLRNINNSKLLAANNKIINKNKKVLLIIISHPSFIVLFSLEIPLMSKRGQEITTKFWHVKCCNELQSGGQF